MRPPLSIPAGLTAVAWAAWRATGPPLRRDGEEVVFPMPTESFELSLLYAATHVPVAPGETVVLRGALRSATDGSVVDGFRIVRAAELADGDGQDPAGLIHFGAGGLRVVAYDPGAHAVTARAMAGPAPGCVQLGVDSPCLVLRSKALAHQQLLTVAEWQRTLSGSIEVDVRQVPGLLVEQRGASGAASPWPAMAAAVAAATVLLALLAWACWRWRRSPHRQLAWLLRTTARAARQANPVLAEVLQPALRATSSAVRHRELDPTSPAGQRLAAALRGLRADLRRQALARRRRAEREIADELLGQVDVALQAAAEASRS